MSERHFGLSRSYEYRRSDYIAPRTQAEAGIEHLEWERDGVSFPFAFKLLASIAVISFCFGIWAGFFALATK